MKQWEQRPNVFVDPEARTGSTRRRLRQFAVAICASLSGLVAGMSLSFEVLGLVELSEMNDVEYYAREITILLFSLIAGAIIGAIRSGIIAHYWGRKPAVITLAIPFIFSSVPMFLNTSLEWIYVSRFWAGLGVGGTFATIPVYLSEIGDDGIRASLGILPQAMFNTGILLTVFIAEEKNFWAFNLSFLVVALIYLFNTLWMPETPQFFISQGRLKEAERSLQWIRKKNTKWLEQQAEGTQNIKKILWREALSDRPTRKALGIALGLVALQKLSDAGDEVFHMDRLFKEAGIYMPEFIRILTLEWTAVMTSLVAVLVADHARRKVLLMISCFSMASCLGVSGLYRYVQEGLKVELSAVSWIPLLCALLYTTMYSMGLEPLPWIIMAELLPPGAKFLASSIVSSSNIIFIPISKKIYSALLEIAGPHLANSFFALTCVICAIFVHYVVPETKGKTLEKIQEEMLGHQVTHL